MLVRRDCDAGEGERRVSVHQVDLLRLNERPAVAGEIVRGGARAGRAVDRDAGFHGAVITSFW
jgi:hypothetical protein